MYAFLFPLLITCLPPLILLDLVILLVFLELNLEIPRYSIFGAGA